MRVLVASSAVPGAKGGSRNIVTWTTQALQSAGHEVDVLLMPHHPDPDLQYEQLIGWRMTSVPKDVEALVCLRWPANLIQHRNKTIWFIHHLRSLFDLAGGPFGADLRKSSNWQLARWIAHLDTQSFDEASRVFSNSPLMSRRIWRFNQRQVGHLYPPLPPGSWPEHPEGVYEPFILMVGRLTPGKRQHLAVEAMAHTRTGVRLHIVGPPESRSYVDKLQGMIASLPDPSRVTLEANWVDEDRKQALLRTCLALSYVPLDEDSYGYPSLEAAAWAKAVITVTDSGGVCEYVGESDRGFICDSDPQSLARMFDTLNREPELARHTGVCNRLFAEPIANGWERVCSKLVAGA